MKLRERVRERTLSLRYGAIGSLLGLVGLTPSLGAPFYNHFPVFIPDSAIKRSDDGAVRQHTYLKVLAVPNASSSAAAQWNTPSTIRNVYQLPSTGGSKAIAIVDAYHYPSALTDFNTFSAQFGLPRETSTNPTGMVPAVGGFSGLGAPLVSTASNLVFQVVYATGNKPLQGGNYIASWNMEAALDIEWAHAMAPGAKIYLVEAANDSSTDLYKAVAVAAQLLNVKEISMSWGGNETSRETQSDTNFKANGIVYIASSGDVSDAMEYPAASPYVVSAGGTTLNRDSTGHFLSESGWANSGCGKSAFESRPSYQNAIVNMVGSYRGVADISFVADPNTGVYIYDSTPYQGQAGWFILGGTSVAAPSLAGVINLASSSSTGFASSTAAEQQRIYSNLGNSLAFRDILVGHDGPLSCRAGWDFITGVGSPLGLSGK